MAIVAWIPPGLAWHHGSVFRRLADSNAPADLLIATTGPATDPPTVHKTRHTHRTAFSSHLVSPRSGPSWSIQPDRRESPAGSSQLLPTFRLLSHAWPKRLRAARGHVGQLLHEPPWSDFTEFLTWDLEGKCPTPLAPDLHR